MNTNPIKAKDLDANLKLNVLDDTNDLLQTICDKMDEKIVEKEVEVPVPVPVETPVYRTVIVPEEKIVEIEKVIEKPVTVIEEKVIYEKDTSMIWPWCTEFVYNPENTIDLELAKNTKKYIFYFKELHIDKELIFDHYNIYYAMDEQKVRTLVFKEFKDWLESKYGITQNFLNVEDYVHNFMNYLIWYYHPYQYWIKFNKPEKYDKYYFDYEFICSV